MLRKPAVAGQFYPADPAELKDAVQTCLNLAETTPAPETLAAFIAPHAGYIFSGPTAGFAYKRAMGMHPTRVILLGGSHRYPIKNASVYSEGAFACPLGTFPIDTSFATELAAETQSVSAEPHLREHALEVHLPFLHVAIGEVPIVPVLFGEASETWHVELGAKLANMLNPADLVIASTDLSHFLSEHRANALDRHTLDTVLTRDPRALARELHAGEASLCGGAAVITAMAYANAAGAGEWTLLDYRTSGPVTGDFSRVVGYAALTMERPA